MTRGRRLIGSAFWIALAATGMMTGRADAGSAGSVSDTGSAGTMAEAGIIVEGAGSVATGEKPARFSVAFAERAAGGAMEITLTPVSVSRNEAYLVVVSEVPEREGASPRQLGSFAFFPPPRAGEARTFIVEQPTGGVGPHRIEVELVPVEAVQGLRESAVRVTGARLR